MERWRVVKQVRVEIIDEEKRKQERKLRSDGVTARRSQWKRQDSRLVLAPSASPYSAGRPTLQPQRLDSLHELLSYDLQLNTLARLYIYDRKYGICANFIHSSNILHMHIVP